MSCVFFFLSVFLFGFYIFYLQGTQQIESDLVLHLNFIDPLLAGQMQLTHQGFQYTIYFISKLLGNNYIIASVIFLSVMLTTIAGIKFFLLKRLSQITTRRAIIFTLSLMLVSAICLPMFNPNLYIGQGSPTIWHNPTILCVKPFAFLCVYLTVLVLESCNRKIGMILSALLLISMIYKPSFGFVFIPALGIYLLCNHAKSRNAYLYCFLMIMPSLLFAFLFQLRNWILSPESNNAVIFSPFGVLHLYTPNAFISFLLATAFPLFLFITHPKRVLANRYLFLSWLMLIIGYLQFAFLAETRHFEHANFAWGFFIALDLVFVFSLIELIALTSKIKSKNHVFPKMIACTLIVLFAAHLVSGAGYLGRYLVTGNFM